MKIQMKNYLILLLSLLIIVSCQHEEIKIPGAMKGMQMMAQQRIYPNTEFPKSGYTEAHDYHVNQFGSQINLRNTDPWEAQGPWNTAGRTLALALNPQDNQTVYLGSASGGLWRSRNLGQGVSWEHMDTGFPVLAISAIAFAPQDSSVMYVGTGEVYNYQNTGTDAAYRATRGSYGIGILKSTDGGQNWEKSLDWSYQQGTGIMSLTVHPDDSNIVYSATSEGVYKTTDGGQNWENILDVIMATDLVIVPSSPDILIASCGNLNSSGKGIYRSIDGGENWTQITTNIPSSFEGKIELGQSPSNPEVIYASIGNGFSSANGYTWLLQTTNAGANWNITNESDYSKWQGWFAHDVAVHPTDPNRLITVGINVWKSTSGGLDLSKKSQGGVTLGTHPIDQPDNNGNPFYSHSDHHVVLYHPTISNLVLLGNDGGLFLSYDEAETFESANGGLQTTQFYNGFSVSPFSDDLAMGGLQDNSTVIFRGDKAWQRVVGGDGSHTAIDPTNDNTMFASAQNLYLTKSVNQGNSFSYVEVPIGNTIFISPYILAPSNPEIIYAGSSYVAKSENGGSSWNFTNNNNELNGDPVFSLAVSYQNPDVVYAGTAPFGGTPSIFLTTDGGDSWQEITGDLPNRFPNDIAVDPTDERIAYVTFSGFGTGHIYKTEDYGETWKDISYDLPDVPGNAVIVDPSYPNHVYYGNDFGVYFYDHTEESWQAFSEGLTGVTIAMDLKISPFDNMLWVATHGNGAYKRPLIEGEVSTTDINPALVEINIFPNPTKDFVNLKLFSEKEFTFDVSLKSIDGKTTHSLGTRQRINPGSNQFRYDLNNVESGMYIIRISEKNNILATRKIQIIN